MQKIYIYSFINKKNGHRYIGKTNDVDRRKREHKSLAFNPKIIGTIHDCTWYKKIREYGWDNFDFEILEVTNELNWEKRERYWIEYYNTFHGVGYNETCGGDDGSHLNKLNEEQAKSVRELLLNTTLSQYNIAIEYNISSTLVSNINQGLKYVDESLKYPLRKNYKTGLEEYSELITLLRTTDKSFQEIADELGMCVSSVKKINYGKMHYDKNFDYPIRKFKSFEIGIDLIIDLLINSDLSIAEIARQSGKSDRTIRRINNGETHYKEYLSYPLRK